MTAINLHSRKTQLFGVGIALLVVILLAFVFGGGEEAPAPASAVTETETPAVTEEEETSVKPETAPADTAAETTTEATAPVAAEEEEVLTPVALEQATLDKALSERSLGKADAPAVIVEYSSLTCSHCGDFHKNTYKKIKETLIDTGKARLVISDFPLNGPALQASMVARCLPADQYFGFIQLLFETQDQWAYSEGFKKYLKQNAQLAGLDAQTFENCFASEPLRAGILAMVQKAQTAHQINSTPTFVINGKEKVEGAKGLEDFEKAIKASK